MGKYGDSDQLQSASAPPPPTAGIPQTGFGGFNPNADKRGTFGSPTRSYW